MRIICAIFCCLMLSGASAYATCGTTTCSDVKITKLYISDGGVTNIETSGVETDLTNCVPVSNKYFRLFNTHSNADKIYAALLAAYLNDLNVRLRAKDTAGNTGECEIWYAVIEPE